MTDLSLSLDSCSSLYWVPLSVQNLNVFLRINNITLRITLLCGIIYKCKGRSFCPLVINLQCFSSIPALSSWCRFPGRCWHHTATADLGFGICSSLPLCWTALVSLPTTHFLPSTVQMKFISLAFQVRSLSLGSLSQASALHVCPLCSPTAQGMLEWLQHGSGEHPLALKEIPAGDCWIFNPQS